MRTETDFIGKVELPYEALYGIHSCRAKENFPDATPFHPEWYKAMGIVKVACYKTVRRFQKALSERYDARQVPLKLLPVDILDNLEESAMETAEGKHFEHFIVPAVNGGAGTSINMNINEIITNTALLKGGDKPGDYQIIDPIEHANVFQSTNDVVPTALRVAAMRLLNSLEEKINITRNRMEILEREHKNDLRIAHTQLQQAVPSSYGKLFSAWSDALSRDWWRISRCSERIKVVNLGGSAVGTGITVPRFYIMEVVSQLQHLTSLPVTRGENLTDATQNMDSFVEVHGILKAHAVNLEKIASDLRLLSSGVLEQHEVEIPSRQVGSSIMPGKVNPVISEFIISAVHKIYSNDMLIGSLSGQGALDLNAYLPLIGHALLDTLKLLVAANETLERNLLSELRINKDQSRRKLLASPSVTTVMVPFIGYKNAAALAEKMKAEQKDIYQANKELDFMEIEKLDDLLKPQNLLKLGFSVRDIMD